MQIRVRGSRITYICSHDHLVPSFAREVLAKQCFSNAAVGSVTTNNEISLELLSVVELNPSCAFTLAYRDDFVAEEHRRTVILAELLIKKTSEIFHGVDDTAPVVAAVETSQCTDRSAVEFSPCHRIRTETLLSNLRQDVRALKHSLIPCSVDIHRQVLQGTQNLLYRCRPIANTAWPVVEIIQSLDHFDFDAMLCKQKSQ